MDLNFCSIECEKGRKAVSKFLLKNNSAYDAFIDFKYFIEECIKTCPYREKVKANLDTAQVKEN